MAAQPELLRHPAAPDELANPPERRSVQNSGPAPPGGSLVIGCLAGLLPIVSAAAFFTMPESWRPARFLAVGGGLAAGGAIWAAETIRRRRRRSPTARPKDRWSPSALEWLERDCRYYATLKPDEQAVFRRRMVHFAATVPVCHADGPPADPAAAEDGKTEPGAPGRRERTALRLEASAAMLGFGFAEADWRAAGLREIIVRAGPLRTGGRADDATGVVTECDESGQMGEEGVMNGVMLLSAGDLAYDWNHPRRGGNVALHELAHLADRRLLARWSGGGGAEAGAWKEALGRERRLIRRGRSDIDGYALTDEREFLAVATEMFFTAPVRFRRLHPALHGLLRRLWRQDPAMAMERGPADRTAPPTGAGAPS